MTAKDTLNLTRFPVVVNTACDNISRVYPLKQKTVSKLFDRASDFDIVKRLIVFGSAVTAKCNIDSDIDICVDADITDGLKVYELQSALGDICDWNCDLIMYQNLGNLLKQTIDKEGVVIYEQSAS